MERHSLALVCLMLLWTGCGSDPRLAGLGKAMAQARTVLQDPRLVELSRKHQGGREQQLVEAFYSPEGQNLWPAPQQAETSYAPGAPQEAPGRIVYLPRPDLPWCVVLQADPAHHCVTLSGFGGNFEKPILTQIQDLPPPPASSPRPAVTPRRRRPRPPADLQMTVQPWGTGPCDCVWHCLRLAGWSDQEIYGNHLVQSMARANRLPDPNLVKAGQSLMVPRKHSGNAQRGQQQLAGDRQAAR